MSGVSCGAMHATDVQFMYLNPNILLGFDRCDAFYFPCISLYDTYVCLFTAVDY